ncbi:MAG: bifunctional glutamate N-acetyltransferase/amino-acid acetyltransferase ArgJ [Alphaproteobacteria bacterium]
MKTSPFAPGQFPVLPPLAGFDMAVAEAGIRYKGRTDLWILRGQAGTQVAGVFTKNRAPGAPVDWSRQALLEPADEKAPRLIAVNSGTANVFTGAVGVKAVIETAQAFASSFGGRPETVFLSSTGVIGQPLDASKVAACVPDMAGRMENDGWEQAARAIMTTDTYPKGSTASASIGGVVVTINGIAKGSGMIAPDMATMLGYIATDAAITQSVLQSLLSELCETSFNAITVDSDTSTSDTVLLAASGAAGNTLITDVNDAGLHGFRSALSMVMLDLSHQIVKDGEGATKFVEVTVKGAETSQSAKNVAMSIANSPLVKTAIAGEDANWGRIVMAVGKSGEPVDRDRLSIWIGPHLLAERGALAEGYKEEHGASYMKKDTLTISVDLGLGGEQFTAWTCDLTHAYIDINADYRS